MGHAATGELKNEGFLIAMLQCVSLRKAHEL